MCSVTPTLFALCNPLSLISTSLTSMGVGHSPENNWPTRKQYAEGKNIASLAQYPPTVKSPQLGAGASGILSYTPSLPASLRAGMLIDLNLWRSYSSNYNFYVSLNESVLPCPKDTVCLGFSLPPGSYFLSTSFSMLFPKPWKSANFEFSHIFSFL